MASTCIIDTNQCMGKIAKIFAHLDFKKPDNGLAEIMMLPDELLFFLLTKLKNKMRFCKLARKFIVW